MLVVDLHTLHTVDVLHLVDDILLDGRRAHDIEYIRGGDSAVGERSAGLHEVVLLHEKLLRQRHIVFLLLAQTRCDDDLAVASLHLAVGHLAVDLGHDGRIGRVAGLEQLGDTGQTARDVTGIAGGAGYLDEYLSGLKLCAVVEHKMSAHRQRIALDDLALGVDDLGLGHLGAVLRLDDDLLLQTGLLVALGAVGHILDKVVVAYRTTGLADDNGVEGVPFAYNVALLHLVAVAEIKLRTVRYVGIGEHHLRVRIHDAHLGHTSDHHFHRPAVGILLVGGDGAQLINLKHALVARGHRRHGSDIAGHTADVERTQSQLCARLADRLCGDDSHGLALLHQAVGSEIAAVALGADTLLRLTGEHRADLN